MGGEPLCPSPEMWRPGLIELFQDRIILHLAPLRESVHCPSCGFSTTRIHSRYRRKSWDLPWSCWPVQLVVHARKFFCDNVQCLRRIFTEPFPGVLAPYARQTQRLSSGLLELVHASNAESAARVGGLLGYVTSPDTLIRLQRQEQFPVLATQILGVDEFALRRGCTYGTILIDLEAHQPVDVLEGKQAEPLEQWLGDHPGVGILARDRSGAYAMAGRIGAPAALQVADRFHLVHNVGDALKELLRSRRWEIPVPQTDANVVQLVPQAVLIEATLQVAEPRPTPRKLALWEEVQKRKGSGQSNRAIARELGAHRKTIRKYLTAAQPPTYGTRLGRRTKLAPYLPYLRQRWEDGCHNARKLYGEMVVRGYTGAETRVKDAVRPWRCKSPPALQRSRGNSAFYWSVLRPFNRLSVTDQQELESVLEANPVLAQGHHLKESFQHIVSQRDVEGLDVWIEEAAKSKVPPFQSLAKGFRQDYEAIKLALTMPWSTGQCEGQNCRVKLIKRLGYGRAKLDLLRQRILHRRVAA
jgi:transposase